MLLTATIVLHIAAALFHQFIRRYRLSRMGFGGASRDQGTGLANDRV